MDNRAIYGLLSCSILLSIVSMRYASMKSTFFVPADAVFSIGAHGRSSPQRTTYNNTIILGAADAKYKEIAEKWYHRLTELGYTTHEIIAVDRAMLETCRNQGLRCQPLIPSQNCTYPLGVFQGQKYRRLVFATRWLVVLRNLLKGRNVFLSDVDNIYERFMSMEKLEGSPYDVFHAFSNGFPKAAWAKAGFSVCGGVNWIRASPEGIAFVRHFIYQCSNFQLTVPENHTCEMICDDQVVLNTQLIIDESSLDVTWNKPRGWNSTPFFRSISGRSGVTNHSFMIWAMDTVYRGPLEGIDGRCPKNPWLSAPLQGSQTIHQWHKFCPNGA